MPGPAQEGISIYALDKDRLSHFYESILGMSRVHESLEVSVLRSSTLQFVIHRIPPNRASKISISTPPQPRESAIRFFFTVPSIAKARSVSLELGGNVASEQWQGPGFIVCDATDPEGNIFHLRENAV